MIPVLGASLHDVLTRLKAEPQRFPKLDVIYSPHQPVSEPISVALPANGIRLRFDGPEQRMRLIEVLDFSKSHITFNERDLVKPSNDSSGPDSPSQGSLSSGPTFRHIYHRMLGPTYEGEFIPPPQGQGAGIYVLSYPGVAFNFSLSESAYSPTKDVVSLLSSAANQVATSMALFSGESWSDARPTLWTRVLPSVKATSIMPRGRDVYPDEVSLVRLHGSGKIQFFRKWTSNSFWMTLGETTPQELVRLLGPPNAIYRKNDRKMTIHQMRTMANATTRTSPGDLSQTEELIDTDQSSMNTGSEESEDDMLMDESAVNKPSGECFYNYFYMGFDVLLSTPVTTSMSTPSENATPSGAEPKLKEYHPERLVATKLVLHGNIPGSYEFNRHRRCRWEIGYLVDPNRGLPVNSEAEFTQIEERMNEKWGHGVPNGKSPPRQRGMVLNRGWGDSPGSSCELLGGWEESGAKRADASGDSTTTLFGFPGMVFEVLKNGYVNTVTVY